MTLACYVPQHGMLCRHRRSKGRDSDVKLRWGGGEVLQKCRTEPALLIRLLAVIDIAAHLCPSPSQFNAPAWKSPCGKDHHEPIFWVVQALGGKINELISPSDKGLHCQSPCLIIKNPEPHGFVGLDGEERVHLRSARKGYTPPVRPTAWLDREPLSCA